MTRPLRLEHEGAIWHVTSRGNERRDIYHDDRDREFFVDTLAEVVDLHRWHLHAWVTMRNHFHLLVETPRVPTLSKGMKRLNETYAQWFNVRHRRVGHLFQGRFKGILTIAEWLGVSGRGVSKMIQVSRERELSDRQYREQLAHLRRRLLGEG